MVKGGTLNQKEVTVEWDLRLASSKMKAGARTVRGSATTRICAEVFVMDNWCHHDTIGEKSTTTEKKLTDKKIMSKWLTSLLFKTEKW